MPETNNTPDADLVNFLNEVENVHADRINPAFKHDGKASRYASLSEILTSVKAVAKKHNLTVRQWPETADGLLRIHTVFFHKSGQVWACGNGMTLKCEGLNAQQIGAQTTYLRRMALQTVCGISVDLDDDGNAAARAMTAQKPSAPVGPWYSFLTAVEAERAHAYCVKKGWLPNSAQDLSELPSDKVDLIVGNKPAFLKAIK
jgi:hypothetical protein